MIELQVVEIAEDRYQIVDSRGRYVAGFPARASCDAFVVGYRTGRADAQEIISSALENLPPRVANGAR